MKAKFDVDPHILSQFKTKYWQEIEPRVTRETDEARKDFLEQFESHL